MRSCSHSTLWFDIVLAWPAWVARMQKTVATKFASNNAQVDNAGDHANEAAMCGRLTCNVLEISVRHVELRFRMLAMATACMVSQS